VVTKFPLGDILHNQDATGRISKWAVELGAFIIKFTPQTAIKSQALIDFTVEWTEVQIASSSLRPEHCTMYFDGSLKLDGVGAGVLLISPKGEQLKYILQILFKASNNEAEYEALLHGLCLVVSLGIKQLLVYGDSSVVIKQVTKEWDRNKENMDAYCEEVQKLEKHLYGLELHHVLRDNNIGADILAKLGSTSTEVPVEVFIQELYKPSIKNPDEPSTSSNLAPDHQVFVINPDWTLPFIEYILHKKVPSDKAEAERMIRRSRNYVVIGDRLFQRGGLS
jgi:ribonuclease HI